MLRTATMADLDFIHSIELSLFNEDIRSSKESIKGSINSKSQEVLILEIDNQRIGCIILFKYTKSYRIYSLGVDQQFQNKGYGKLIMNEVIQLANIQKVNLILEVDKNNEKLVSFYKSFGFQISSVLENYYGENKDGLKMTLPYIELKLPKRNLVVVDRELSWLKGISNIEIIHANDYIKNEELDLRSRRVFNLCDSYKYQMTGYYVSLLAIARDHQVIPNITTIKDFSNKRILRSIAEEIDELIQEELKEYQFEKFSLLIYFGQTKIKGLEKVAKELYKLFEAPFIEVEFQKYNKWLVNKAAAIHVNKIPTSDFPYVHSCAEKYFSQKRFTERKLKNYRYDLAILVNPDEPTPPSNPKALSLFKKAAEEIGFYVEFITKKDYHRINEFDALFIRETTDVNNHTYDFSRFAYSEGLVVVDDPWSIFKCSNKIFLNERLKAHNIKMPETIVVNSATFKAQEYKNLTFPVILKKPDSSFSKGVFKVDNYNDFITKMKTLFKSSQLVLVQSFVKSEYDWRIGVLNNTPIYACKYFMADSHWQIYNWESTDEQEGNSMSYRIEDVPANVIEAAVKSASLIGNGLYGVDLKEVNGEVYLIEINDNPNVDFGFEDAIKGYDLYKTIMNFLLEGIEKERNSNRYLNKP